VIILDTNVISEIMKPPAQRSRDVFAWLAAQDGEKLYTTSVTFDEIAFGFELLPDGQRKRDLMTKALEVFEIGLLNRILDYDLAAARHYAAIAARRIRNGLAVPPKDVMIAAIAADRGMSVSTRNVKDFTDCGIHVINPWEYRGA
jgi:toxin FitB